MWSAEEVLQYWFCNREDSASTLRRRFSSMMLLASEGACENWEKSPRGLLSLIVLLHFIQKAMFSQVALQSIYGRQVQRLCRKAVEASKDTMLSDFERAHIYVAMQSSPDSVVRADGQRRFDAIAPGLDPAQLKTLGRGGNEDSFTA